MFRCYSNFARHPIGNLQGGEFTVRFKPHDQAQAVPNPITQEDLEIIHAKNTLWVHEQPGGEQADFSGQDLSGRVFERMTFIGVKFRGADMNCGTLGNGIFNDCDFSEAMLRDVSAQGVEMDSVLFDGATLENCSFQSAFLQYASFDGAHIVGCDFTNAELYGADFSQAELVDCTGLEHLAQGQSQTM